MGYHGALWRYYTDIMQMKIIVHEAEEGGFWAEVPAIPGCASQGETRDQLMKNVREAIAGCLTVDVEQPRKTGKDEVVEITV